MATLDRSNWLTGASFVLRDLTSRVGTGGGRLDDVAAPGIPEPEATAEVPAPVTPARRLGPNGDMAHRAVPTARRPLHRRPPLRLVPLGAFAGRGMPGDAKPRTRAEHVLLIVTVGQVQLRLPRQATLLEAGDLCYLPAGTAFTTLARPEAEGHLLMMAPDLTAGVDPPFLPAMMVGGVSQGLDALLVNLRELAQEAARGPDGRGLGCHLNLLSLRLSRLAADGDRDRKKEKLLPDRPLVERFLALAGADLGSCRTLAEMAQDLGTSLTHLDRTCLQARGRRAIDLLHELRLERAAELLRHTDRPLSRLAQDLGYASRTHFTRAFVAATGRTPEAYRAQMR